MKAAKAEFTYRFCFPDGRTREWTVKLDPHTAKLIERPDEGQLPSWTALDHFKCAHCPLKKEESPHCPVAANLASVAEAFSTEKSYAKVVVEVLSPERTYVKNIGLQEGLFGIFGLLMATSACPHMAFLRPMARFHLPFSSVDETMSRSVSFYLFRQYFLAGKGEKADFELKDYGRLYEEVEKVNAGIVARIRSISKADAETNSIVILDGFAKMLSIHISTNFPDLEPLFTSE